MCAWLHACVHVCVLGRCVCVHMCVCVCVCVCVHVCVVCWCVWIHFCMSWCACVCVCVCTCACTCMCVHAHAHISVGHGVLVCAITLWVVGSGMLEHSFMHLRYLSFLLFFSECHNLVVVVHNGQHHKLINVLQSKALNKSYYYRYQRSHDPATKQCHSSPDSGSMASGELPALMSCWAKLSGPYTSSAQPWESLTCSKLWEQKFSAETPNSSHASCSLKIQHCKIISKTVNVSTTRPWESLTCSKSCEQNLPAL